MKTTEKDRETAQAGDQRTKGQKDQRTEAVPSTKTSRKAKPIRLGKARCDSTLDRLPAERRERLESWLFDENRGYREVRELAAREWGVQTSRSAVGRYYTRWLVPRQLAEAEEAAEAMGQVDGERLGEAALQRARMLGFMALMEPVPDAKAAQAFLGIVDDFERRELARDRLKLAERRERRCAKRDAPPKKSGIWKLPYEEKMRHLKGVFGIAPDYEFAAWMTEEEKAIHLRPAGQTRSAEPGTRNDETRNAEGGTGNPDARSAELGTRTVGTDAAQVPQPGSPGPEGTSSGRSETAPLQVTAEAGGGIPQSRDHGSQNAAVTIGRVLGAETPAQPVALPAVQALPPSAGAGATKYGDHELLHRSGGAPAESRTESIRAVTPWQGVSPGAPGSFHVGTGRPELIFGLYGPDRIDERGALLPRPGPWMGV